MLTPTPDAPGGAIGSHRVRYHVGGAPHGQRVVDVLRASLAETQSALVIGPSVAEVEALAAVLAEAFGWRMAFLVVGIPGILFAAILLAFVREPLRGRWDRVGAAAVVVVSSVMLGRVTRYDPTVRSEFPSADRGPRLGVLGPGELGVGPKNAIAELPGRSIRLKGDMNLIPRHRTRIRTIGHRLF